MPVGYRMRPRNAVEETGFEPDDGPTFTSRTTAFESSLQPRVFLRVARALLPTTASELRAREAAFDMDGKAAVKQYPWGFSVRVTEGLRMNVWAFARLATSPPLASSCHVGFGVAKGDAAKLPSLAAQAETICASLRGE